MQKLYKKIGNEYFLLLLITIVGCLLRFYKLGEVPVGFHQDEAFFGYNAYSILKTGKDMTGNFLPIHLESFWYSPGLYSYFAIPLIAIFDLTPFAVRFPSAIFGTFTIIALFFLVRELFMDYKYKIGLSLASSFFLAVNPWSINLSRTATENIPVVFFVVIGVLLFLMWKRYGKLYLLSLSFASFFISLLIYQAPRAFLPLFVPILLLLVYKKMKLKKLSLFFVYFLLLIVAPVIFFLSSSELSTRVKSLSIFSSPRTQLLLDEAIREDGVMDQKVIVARVFHNKVLAYSTDFTDNYFNHLSYNFFFTDQALPHRYKVPDMGLLYIFELPFILLGIFFIFKQKIREGLFLMAWILLAPVSSGLTTDDIPNLQRTVVLYPPLAIIAGFGMINLYQIAVKSKKVLQIFTATGCLIVFYCLAYYLHQYYVQQLVHQPVNRQEGYKSLVAEVNSSLPSYRRAVISGTAGSPAILFLFYSKYDPYTFQKKIEQFPVKTVDKIDRFSFDKYSFYNQDCFQNYEKDILYVERGSCSIPGNTAKDIREVKRKDGSVVFRIFALKD